MSVFYALRRGRHGSSLMYFLSRLSRQYGAAWWLALALCLAPTWGHIHRVLHLPHALGWAERVEGSLGALLASHSPADCELLDQLSHAGPVSEPCTHAPSVPPLSRCLERNHRSLLISLESGTRWSGKQ